MDLLVAYFESIPSTHRAAILVGGITFFWLWESAIPLFRFHYSKWQHALINLFFTFTTIVVNFALAFILLRTADFVVAQEVGLLFWIPALPFFWYTLLGLMLLDLISAWFAHWVQHKIPLMWRFHLIHHADQQVDTTTANRHHPVESVVRFFFTALAVLLLGTPMWLVFLYQSLSVVLSQFNHANIRLPEGLDQALSWVIVSPNMHKVHHHYLMPHTDTNYGNIFSVWDRLFGTFQTMSKEDLVYGIDTHMNPTEVGRISRLLKLPFIWRKPNS